MDYTELKFSKELLRIDLLKCEYELKKFEQTFIKIDKEPMCYCGKYIKNNEDFKYSSNSDITHVNCYNKWVVYIHVFINKTSNNVLHFK